MMQMSKNKSSFVKTYSTRFIALCLILSLAVIMCSCSTDNDFDGIRFAKTKTISVLSDGSDPELEKYIHDSVLEDCNIDVRFVSEDYYSQAYGIIPDVAYSYDLNSITTYYKMDSVLNVAPVLDVYEDSLTYLNNVLFDKNTAEVWYLIPESAAPKAKITFIRADWLEDLGLGIPATRDELYDCLIAFRDNAELLLGEDSSEMIPFLIDSEPNISCKPLFDSFYDTDINDEEFYENGYCRAVQDGYSDGLAVLNEWYLEDLLPDNFNAIIPGSKESYEPIENGYVGAFCADYDYLYKNGDNSIIKAFHDNCGDDAAYIAVNTFENVDGDYTCWQEDYLETPTRYIYMPSTCSEPLACMVYLNWLSKPENVASIKTKAAEDPDAYSYLLTLSDEQNDELNSSEDAQSAKETAEEVKYITKAIKCVKYDSSIFTYVESDVDIKTLFPESLYLYSYTAITAPEGCFDSIASEAFDVYVNSGAGVIFKIRSMEWNKVMVEEKMWPW